jgi:hypothetical protein
VLKLPKILYLACLLLFSLSCSKNQTKSSSISASNYHYQLNNHDIPEDPAMSRFIVTPEIAVMKGEIVTTASSFNEVIQLLKTNSDQLINSVSKIKGCSVNIRDYQHPIVSNSSKAIFDNAKKYSSSVLEIKISFAQTKNIQERIQQINNCLQAIPELKIDNFQKDQNASVYLTLSRVMPTIKDGEKYRTQLLATKFARLKEVTKFPQAVGQFQSLNSNCTSEGIVQVMNRSLSGIELDIDFSCRPSINKEIVILDKEM